MLIGTLVSSKICTLYELQTIYGIQDAHAMLEIVSVDAHNHNLLNQEPE
jgi:hypothetical protein